MAFGFGAHFCIGAVLARLEGRILLEELLAGSPPLEVAGPVVRTASPVIAGVKSAPAGLRRRLNAADGPAWETRQVFVTNHVLSGVLIGRALEGRPLTAFAAGVGSHLVIDAIPHWGCDKTADDAMEQFLRMARRDGVLGVVAMAAAALAVDRRARPAVIAAMAGAVLLDLDKPIEYFFGIYPFPDRVRRLHSWVQRESPAGMPVELAFGAAAATADVWVAAGSRRRTDGSGPERPRRAGARRAQA